MTVTKSQKGIAIAILLLHALLLAFIVAILLDLLITEPTDGDIYAVFFVTLIALFALLPVLFGYAFSILFRQLLIMTVAPMVIAVLYFHWYTYEILPLVFSLAAIVYDINECRKIVAL